MKESFAIVFALLFVGITLFIAQAQLQYTDVHNRQTLERWIYEVLSRFDSAVSDIDNYVVKALEKPLVGVGFKVESMDRSLKQVSSIIRKDAYKQGLRIGDDILEVNGKKIITPLDVVNETTSKNLADIGSSVTLKIRRRENGNDKDISLKLTRALLRSAMPENTRQSVEAMTIGFVVNLDIWKNRATKFVETVDRSVDKFSSEENKRFNEIVFSSEMLVEELTRITKELKDIMAIVEKEARATW
jgi:C-terminal processing protease CtpA/Prc